MGRHVADAITTLQLKGGDSVLYHAIKLYKLAPELRWTAGGYIWPVDQVVEFSSDVAGSPTSSQARMPISVVNGGRAPPMRAPISSGASEPGEDEEPEDEHHPSHDMTPLKHTLLTVAIVASGFTIAYFVDDLKMGASFCSLFDGRSSRGY